MELTALAHYAKRLVRRRKKTAFSVSAYIRYNETILLLHHRRLGMWVPPGGSMERGETPLRAIQREVLEETGMRTEFRPYLANGMSNIPGLVTYEEIYDDPDKDVGMNFVFFAFANDNFVIPNEESFGYRWVGHDCDELRHVPDNVRKHVKLLTGF